MPYGWKEYEEDIAWIIEGSPALIESVREIGRTRTANGDTKYGARWLAIADDLEADYIKYRDRFTPKPHPN